MPSQSTLSCAGLGRLLNSSWSYWWALTCEYAQYFHNISTTTLKHHRDPQAAKSKNYPKILPFISPSPKFKFNTCPSNYSLDNTDTYFTTMNIPAKLQHLVQQEINHASDPFINPLLKINAVLDTTTGKLLNTNN